jgi:hypothetical protein
MTEWEDYRRVAGVDYADKSYLRAPQRSRTVRNLTFLGLGLFVGGVLVLIFA